MPAQPARSLVSLCSVSSSGPLAWPLGAPEASVSPGCAWLWRRCSIRVPDGGEPWPVFISLVAPAFLQYLPAHPHPGCRKTGSGSPGMGMAAVSGLDPGPRDDRKVQSSQRGEFGFWQTRKDQIPQAKLPPLRRPRFHTAASAAVAARRPNLIGWGTQEPRGAELPPSRAVIKACQAQVTSLTCKGPPESGAKSPALLV